MARRRKIKVKALKTEQGGGIELFSFFLPGKEIFNIAQISRLHRDSKNKLEGFQRKEIRNHVKKIVEYLETGSVLFAFALTLFAGLSTGIGSAIAFFAKSTNTKFLSLSLGFSAGVMIYVSFVEILKKSNEALTTQLGEVGGWWVTVGSFFGGILLIAIIDKLIPSHENPHYLIQILLLVASNKTLLHFYLN